MRRDFTSQGTVIPSKRKYNSHQPHRSFHISFLISFLISFHISFHISFLIGVKYIGVVTLPLRDTGPIFDNRVVRDTYKPGDHTVIRSINRIKRTRLEHSAAL